MLGRCDDCDVDVTVVIEEDVVILIFVLACEVIRIFGLACDVIGMGRDTTGIGVSEGDI